MMRNTYRELHDFDVFLKNKYGNIIGVDEAGRGPLAGPVVSAAVFIEEPRSLIGVDDSKKIAHSLRERVFEMIKEAAKIGVGIATPEEIDILNIFKATELSMERAIKDLFKKGIDGFVIVDGKNLKLCFKNQNIVKGDSKSLSIAAASIVAKVIRDRIMIGYSKKYSQYFFEKNKGYPTREHIDSLKRFGVTPFHRLSYKPVLLNLKEDLLSSWFKNGIIDFERYVFSLRRLKKLVDKMGEKNDFFR